MRYNRSDILFTLAVIAALYVAYRAIDVLLLVYVSALFAVVITPAIGFVRRMRVAAWRPGRGVALAIILFCLLLSVTLFGLFAVPPIYHDAQALATNWPARMAEITQKVHGIPFLENVNPGNLAQSPAEIIGGAFGFARNVAGVAFVVFYWLILTTYFILDGERVFHWGLSMIPFEHRDRLERTLLRAENRMRHWLIGQGALMLILGTSSMIVFGLMHLKYFYALAVFAGLANIVPIVGPLTAFALSCVVAMLDSPAKLLGVVAFFAIYQQVETGFFTPRIMKSTVDLPPLAVIVALSLGGTLAGVAGALVAVPTAALCAVLIDEYLVKRDSRIEVPEEQPTL